MDKTTMITIVGSAIEAGPIPFNIYSLDSKRSYILFCKAGYEITVERKLQLNERNRTFYVQSEELVNYLDYAANRINQIVLNPNIKVNEKTLIMKSVGDRLIHRILQNPKSGRTYELTDNFVNSHITMLTTIPEVKNDLFSVAAHGSYLFSHSFNVCTLCLLLGEVIYEKNRRHLWRLGLGGLLHDLGMTKVDRAIVEKPGRLTAEEMAAIKKHPGFSREMLILSGYDFPDSVVQMVYSHHERPDGTGYPEGLYADEIHPYAHLAAVADTYDAITSDKPYKKMETHIVALDEMAKTPDKFDKQVIEALLKVVLIDDRLVAIFSDKFKL
jgi:HD-GYP domain-containing protein (c-di-GMP phosphodiesterase class II)